MELNYEVDIKCSQCVLHNFLRVAMLSMILQYILILSFCFGANGGSKRQESSTFDFHSLMIRLNETKSGFYSSFVKNFFHVFFPSINWQNQVKLFK